MIDGILDLLTAILVLGIVVAIAFGFILPLANPEYMDFDIQYYDKGELNNIMDYSDPSQNDKLTKRMYTYEELLMLLNIQDDHLPNPRVLNARNLITNEDLSYSGYNGTSGKGASNGRVNLNDLYNNKYAMYVSDEVFHTLVRYGGNNMGPEGYSERSPLQSFPAEDNFGAFFIDGKYSFNSKYILNEMNGADMPDRKSSLEPDNSIARRYQETKKSGVEITRLGVKKEIIAPDESEYASKRIYYISYHFAVPNDSISMDGATGSLLRNDDEVDSYFIEVEGKFPRRNNANTDNNMTVVDTWKEYQNYLVDVRKHVTNMSKN